jgi:2-hydroxy-6-oxonona-2,4-dienedioate hydrolase
MSLSVVTSGEYTFVDEGEPSDVPPILLLHGMLGEIENWEKTAKALAANGYRVLIPFLPVYDLPIRSTSVPGLVEYVRAFAEHLGLHRVAVGGNSLGGHVALLYTLSYPGDVCALILSGASGIYELELGSSTPRRRDRAFIRERAAMTFYDPVHVTEHIVESMYDLLGDRARVARLIKMARSAKVETVTDRLSSIEQPTLLVWGRDDRITPPDVANQFKQRMPAAELHLIDRCGHAPMVEHPEEFSRVMLAFLGEAIGLPRASAA